MIATPQTIIQHIPLPMQIWIDIIVHTYLMEENKRFSEIGILSYLKGKEVSWIVDKFKDEAGKMDNRRRH